MSEMSADTSGNRISQEEKLRLREENTSELGVLSQRVVDPGKLYLFWGSGCPPSWRVQLALYEKKLDFVGQLISFERNDTRTEEFLKVNPRGRVPVLVDGPVIMSESLAILSYLERSYPENPLMPKEDRNEFASALTRMHESNNLSQAISEVAYYVRRIPRESISREYHSAIMQNLNNELQFWETALVVPFLCGKHFSLADASFFPYLAYAVRLGYDLERFPGLSAYYAMMCRRSSVKASWPPHWKLVEGLPLLSSAPVKMLNGSNGVNGDAERPLKKLRVESSK